MEKPRGTKESEFESVLKLINQIFRINRGYESTMEQEFPLLLTRSNADNMRIIKEDGKPVSCVNFVERNILIDGNEILTASIGAVCTNEKYRGKGYSSLLLEDVEKKMYEDGVDLALVSGTRALYQRRGYTLTKNFIKYEIYPEKVDLNFQIEEFKEDNLLDIARLYNTASTRFVRPMEDFKKLIKSALFPWGNVSYKSYVIKENTVITGYVFIRILNDTDKIGIVVEAMGRNDYIEEGLKIIAYLNNLKFIEYKIHIADRSNFQKDVYHKGLGYQAGSVKIINFESFMEKLRPYFRQYVEAELINKIQFKSIENKPKCEKQNIKVYEEVKDNYLEEDKINISEQANKGLNGFKFNVTEEILNHIEVIESKAVYRVVFEEEVLEIKDIRTLNKLIFEGGSDLELNYSGKKKLKGFIEAVFPVPFVYAANLNYQ